MSQVMAYAYRQERFSTIPEEDEEEMAHASAEEKSGELVMLCPASGEQRVQLKVYRTTLEHFAVLYPPETCRPLGVMNLRHTTCQRLNGGARSGLVLRQGGYDCPASLTFLCESPRDVPGWTAALSSPPGPYTRQCSLPVVEEDDEF